MPRMAAPQLVRRIALDVLQRTPTAEEVAQAAPRAPIEVAQRMLGTLEAMEVWLEEELLYFLLLDNFRPTTPNVAALPRLLHERRTDVRAAQAEILLSTAFSLRNPGNDTFVTVVLEQCLGLEVQDRRNAAVLEAGKKAYDGYATRFLGGVGRSQADVVKLALADRRSTRHLLDRHHRRLFGEPLPATQEDAVDVVHASPGELFTVLARWIGSERYADPARPRRAMSDHQFARSLWLDLLGRTPGYDELRMVRNALLAMADPAPLRAVLAKILLDSGRAKLPRLPPRERHAEFVHACFMTYLRRAPSAAETEAFVRELDAVQTPSAALVVRALVTSEEYGTY